MTHTISHPSTILRRDAVRRTGQPSCPDRSRKPSRHRRRRELATLGRYTDLQGRSRELLTQSGAGGSVLVVDRDVATLGDRRLVAHLGADEPADNAALVSRHYLAEADRRGGCRRVTAEDFLIAPFADDVAAELCSESTSVAAEPTDGRRHVYRLELLRTGMSIPELRWRRHPSRATDGEPQLVSLREAIASLESYEPVRALTAVALLRHRGDAGVSITVLRAELERVQRSPIVLNRGLREAVLARTAREGLSMSEIATRCGRVKRDRKGVESGETSWLARRIGLLAEGGGGAPTPWIHSDVLALIARDGLGTSPREVELG